MSILFTPTRLGGVSLANRVVVAPMCQYSAREGVAQPWHWQHLGSMAVSGAGAVIVEASAVTADGRITPQDLGLWNDEQAQALTRLIADVRTYSATPFGIQLAHAGRKAAIRRPWEGGEPIPADDPRAWPVVGPSATAFTPASQVPAELTLAEMAEIRDAFVAAAHRALACGFDLVELHGAHGYLLQEFVSPLVNSRTDAYGGSLENRLRFPLEVAEAVRAIWPRDKALGMRINGTDWSEGGTNPEEAAVYASALEGLGLDYVCVSSGGAVAHIPAVPGLQGVGRQLGYQLPFAEQVKAAVKTLAVMGVGMIVDPHQAEAAIAEGRADLVAIARTALDDPRWPIHAAVALGATPPYPSPYERAGPKMWAGYATAHS